MLGYIMKNDTARDAALRLQNAMSQAMEAPLRQTVYRLAYTSAQGRVTSTFEACHLLLGLPVVRMSREFQWVHTGMPETYTTFIPLH